MRPLFHYFALFLFATALLLFLLEIVLRFSGTFNTYSEDIGKGYQSYYNKTLPTWYPFWTAGDSFLVDHKDFQYSYVINSLGFRGGEIAEKANDSARRIIVLGDSFAEGMGAPADSSWPKLLESKFRQNGFNAEVINAGISGSDPFFEYIFLRDKLMQFTPDYVIVSINATDIEDYVFKGGMERFHADGTTHYRKGPRYETLYAHSHIVRAFFKILGYPMTGVFLNEKDFIQEMRNSLSPLCGVIDSFSALVSSRNCKLLVVVHPGPIEAVNTNSTTAFYPKPYMMTLLDSLNNKHIPTISLYPHFEDLLAREPFERYAYKNDGHFNSNGYASFAEAVFDSVKKQQLLP